MSHVGDDRQREWNADDGEQDAEKSPSGRNRGHVTVAFFSCLFGENVNLWRREEEKKGDDKRCDLKLDPKKKNAKMTIINHMIVLFKKSCLTIDTHPLLL